MLDLLQSIVTEGHCGFLPVENVDTSLINDGEVLRNMHSSCRVYTWNPPSEEVLEDKHVLYFEMLIWNELIEILQICYRQISPILFIY